MRLLPEGWGADRKLVAAIFAVVVLAPAATAAASPRWEQANNWFVGVKRVAKAARVAATTTADLGRLRAADAEAKQKLKEAAELPLSEAGRTTCGGAARAIIDFIAAAEQGKMTGGPASFDRQQQRWESLGDQCLSMIQAETRTN